jgi:hypothetical protein
MGNWIHFGDLRIARIKIQCTINKPLGNALVTMGSTEWKKFLPVQPEYVIARFVRINNLKVRLFADLFDDRQAQPIVLAVGFYFIKSPEDPFFIEGFQQTSIAYSKLAILQININAASFYIMPAGIA